MREVENTPSMKRATIRYFDHNRLTVALVGDPKTGTKRKRTVSGDVSSGVHGLTVSHCCPAVAIPAPVVRGGSAASCGGDVAR